MYQYLTARRDREEGFTLIELMVVVLIIAILIAIAIPTFLGARERAQDRSAQSSLRNAVTAAKTLFTDSEDYATATPTALAEVEPSLTYDVSTEASTGPREISVLSTGPVDGDGNPLLSRDTIVVMSAESASGTCFAIRDNVQGPGTEFGTVTTGACTAANANGGGVGTWAQGW